MKDPKEWGVDDLNELIATQAEESSALEFKHGKVLEDLNNHLSADKRRKTEISIDLSAFANRAGGVIVYGMEEEQPEPHCAKALTPIDPAKCSKERLEQIIMSRIKPRIHPHVNPVKIASNGYAYVVVIPASHTAHQASDGRYYRRLNFGNEIMEDDEIRQIMNRPIRPTYHVRLSTRQIGKELVFSGAVQNTSVMMGNDVSAVLLLPSDLTSNLIAGTEVIEGNTIVRLLDQLRAQVKSQLKPFEHKEICYTCTVPDVPPSATVPLFVRVYDQFGQAHEATFSMSLAPGHIGEIIDEQQ